MPRRILLIISGGIAAYKSLELIRLIRKAGHEVSVVLTAGATEFVTPLSVQTLSGDAPYVELFSATEESRIGHIALSRDADIILVCPATAHMIAKMRLGLADDLASTLLLATDTPIAAAPAMNVRMWQHPATQENIQRLQKRGVVFIGPDEGDMACGEYGPGRLVEPEAIMDALSELLAVSSGSASGLHVLVTAGPTHEALDPVRYLANHSSGKQGFAIARAFAKAGARVTLVSGPTSQPTPPHVARIDVLTADEMLAACQKADVVDVAICAAAVADWRPKEVASQKLKKGDQADYSLTLVKNPDILATLAGPGPNRPRLVVGFAAETDNLHSHADAKRRHKKCDWIVANPVNAGSGVFGGDCNTVTIIDGQGREDWPKMSKDDVARRLVQRVLETLTPTHTIKDENNP